MGGTRLHVSLWDVLALNGFQKVPPNLRSAPRSSYDPEPEDGDTIRGQQTCDTDGENAAEEEEEAGVTPGYGPNEPAAALWRRSHRR